MPIPAKIARFAPVALVVILAAAVGVVIQREYRKTREDTFDPNRPVNVAVNPAPFGAGFTDERIPDLYGVWRLPAEPQRRIVIFDGAGGETYANLRSWPNHDESAPAFQVALEKGRLKLTPPAAAEFTVSPIEGEANRFRVEVPGNEPLVFERMKTY